MLGRGDFYRMFQKTIWACLGALLICTGLTAHAQTKPPEWLLSEKLIVTVDLSAWVKESLRVSPDSKRVAYAAQVGSKWFVVVGA